MQKDLYIYICIQNAREQVRDWILGMGFKLSSF